MVKATVPVMDGGDEMRSLLPSGQLRGAPQDQRDNDSMNSHTYVAYKIFKLFKYNILKKYVDT